MTHMTRKRLVQLGTTMLATGALLLPTLGSANITAALAGTPTDGTPVAITKTATQSPAPNDFRKLKKTVGQLNLSAEQQQKVDQLFAAAQPQAAELQKNMRDIMQQMQDLMYPANGQYDAKQVSLLANRQGELVTQMLEVRAKLNYDVYETLTADQQQKLRTLMAEKKNHKKKEAPAQ